jgi:NTP pyrophosphatase (non-canonical NTP hydrolase)
MTFGEYQRAAAETAIYPREAAVMYPALGLNGEAGEVAEKVKKCIRDAGGLFQSRREEIAKEIGDCLWYAANLCSDLGLRLEDVAAANLAKLQSRKERGVLQGSGDGR